MGWTLTQSNSPMHHMMSRSSPYHKWIEMTKLTTSWKNFNPVPVPTRHIIHIGKQHGILEPQLLLPYLPPPTTGDQYSTGLTMTFYSTAPYVARFLVDFEHLCRSQHNSRESNILRTEHSLIAANELTPYSWQLTDTILNNTYRRAMNNSKIMMEVFIYIPRQTKVHQ